MRVIASNRPVEDDGDSTSPGRAQYSASGTLTRGAGGELGFGGPHNGTFMSVFADGSVHPLSTNIDNTATGVFYRLGNRHDGMTIQDKDYQP
jgi:prepilin-type processing-associated H-X9-DG protein